MWSISRVPFLTVSVSAAGLLSLTLSGLLPWPALLALLAVHAWVALNFTRELPVATRQVMLLTALFILMEITRILVQGSHVVTLSLRDVIVYFGMLRLLLPKTGREVYQIVAIGLAQCILSTIFTTSPLFLIGLVLMGVLIPMTLSALDEEGFGGNAGRRQGIMHWASVYAGIVLASCILFFIIPRPSSTLISYALDSRGKKVFSEGTDLARKDDVGLDRQILMRVFWTRGNAPGMFYLSGARLDDLTEQGFVRGPSLDNAFIPAFTRTDALTIYQTDLEALNVFYPFRVSDIAPPFVSLKGINLYWNKANPPVYEVWVDRSGDRAFRPGLSVPEGLQDVASLGRRIAGGSPPDVAAQRLVAYLGRRCAYSLEGQRVPPGIPPVQWFLQVSRRGSCEHFATALAVMLRGCGIHSRVVTGFMVHEFNSAGGYYIVRGSDAHAWVEYLSAGAWRTCEATPQSLSPTGHDSSVLDAIRFAWIRWVIRYSLNDQIHIALAISSPPVEFEHKVGYVLSATFAVAMLALALWLLTSGLRKGTAGPYGTVIRAFGRRGLHLTAGGSHEEHLAQVEREWPAMGMEFRAYLGQYLPWRFGTGLIDIRGATDRAVEAIRNAGPPGSG